MSNTNWGAAYQYAGLIAVPILLSIGQILFKIASASVGEGASVRAMASNPYLLTALVLYAIGTVIWLFVLSRVDLVRAYPFAALSFVLVPMLSHWILAERFGTAYIVGVAFLVVGVVLCQL